MESGRIAKDNLDLGIGRVHPADPRSLASDYAGAAHCRFTHTGSRRDGYDASGKEDRAWSPVSSPSGAAWEERQEEERWDESLVSDYVRNGRYSPTRPFWRPPRPPTPHRALQSSEEEEEEEQPIIIIDSDEDEVGEQDEIIVISDSEEGETPEPPRVSASYAGKVVGGRLEHRAEVVITWSEPLTTKPARFILEEVSPPETPPQATPPPPIPQETPPQTTPQQATAPPPTPPETSMDADEEWRPIRLPARPALQRQVSEPAPPPPQRPTLQRQVSWPDAGAAQWVELRREEWPVEVEQHAARIEAQGSGRTARIVWARGTKYRVRRTRIGCRAFKYVKKKKKRSVYYISE
ncbi:protein phosphatase 1 regulatory subunit 37-like [Drosophila mojavensis]|uniref:protein phosphatase 1 regulatory subunit 37-like n=1 Tax=Drosophila mojavensis TaxID=7230 RepID=UPI001CD0A5F6|nr:protein phosphatase 1 regulatory subunit 37-like [Drosophila mojavensis]